MQTTTVPTLPSIKFLLESSVEMFNGVNGDRQVPVEPRSPTNSYINSNNNSSSRKLPTLSLNIPSPKGYLISPVEENKNMSEYHQKGNHFQNNLPRLPSIGQFDSVLNNSSNNNRNTTTIVQKNSRPNSIQSLLSPPESPDMANNPFNDYTTSPVYPSNIVPLCTPPHYHQSYASQSYVQPERGFERYHQERVNYDRSYTEHRAYSSSTTSPTTIQPSYPSFESRSTVSTTLPPISPMLNNESVITRRLSAPISTKIINDTLTSPITGIVPSTSVNNNRYQCPYCSKRFSRPSSLRIHTYSHTGEKPFVCTEPGCGRKFSVQSNMRRHLRVHRLGRPVKKVRYDGEVEGVKMLNHGAIMRNC
ncbi:unnamed protein product [Rhizophagus irregularis]|nr:unnamed protein product [Rhizophagus irregularis]CAB4423656.1 unnamed protein product [Rhizophagus irregularis]